MRFEVALEGRTAMVDAERTASGWRVRIDRSDWVDVPGRFFEPGELRLTWGGRSHTVGVHAEGDRVAMQIDGQHLGAVAVDPRRAHASLAGGAAQGVIVTPMPGVVVRLPVAVGQSVHAGQVLVVVEAMKMENEFKAPFDGVVQSVSVAVGQALEANTTLITLAPPAP